MYHGQPHIDDGTWLQLPRRMPQGRNASHKLGAIVALLSFTCLATTNLSWGQERIHFQINPKKLFSEAAEPVEAQPVNHNGNYGRLNDIERQVYGREYPEQDDSQRITRLEQSIFGGRQLGNMDMRYQRIAGRLNEKNLQSNENNQGRMLDYMEQKLFEQVYNDESIETRLSRLETHVFGKPFDSYPADIRFKKLSYALPVLSRGIKVTSRTQDRVVASTLKPVNNSATNAVAYTSASFTPAISGEAPSHSRDYALNIYRIGAEQALRWEKLPVYIHFHNMTEENTDIAKIALQQWQHSFPIELINTATQADIILDGRNGTSLLTHPVIQLDHKQHIRTTVTIQAGQILPLQDAQRIRALSHQIGHALGIWGHSDDEHDVMYPYQPFEQNDIPSLWLRRSPKPMIDNNNAASTVSVTQRDRNTLRRLYELEALDLRSYTPNTSR